MSVILWTAHSETIGPGEYPTVDDRPALRKMEDMRELDAWMEEVQDGGEVVSVLAALVDYSSSACPFALGTN